MGKLKKSTQHRTLACFGGWKANYQPTPITDTLFTAKTWSDQVQFSDNVIGWKERIAQGLPVNTTMVGGYGVIRNFSAGRWTQTTSPGDANYQTWGNGDLLHAYLVDPMSLPGVPSSDLERARSAAEIAFTKRFRKHTTQFESGVFAGELLEATRMLISPAKHMRQAIGVFHHDLSRRLQALKRNQFRVGRTQTLKAARVLIAGSWLEFNFGVKPFVSDLDNAARAFRALASGRTFENVRFTGDGVAESAITSMSTWTTGTPGFLADAKHKVEIIDSSYVSVHLGGAWKSDHGAGFMPVPMVFGTRLGDILPTAWELLPWSFLYDYFVNIGDVLTAWGMRQVNFNWINETIRSRVERRVLAPARYFWTSPFVGFPRETKVTLDGEGYLSMVRYNVSRLPYTNDWDPQFQVKIPGVTGSDQTKWLNIAALLAMRMSPLK